MKLPKVRVGVIGCGAAAEIGHLPALRSNADCAISALIDKNPDRLAPLAHAYAPEMTSDDYRDCFGRIDAAIVALPHHLHEPIAIDLLKNGIHVLVDKPMAMSAEECDRMIEAAEGSGRVLAVGLMRRFLYSARLVKEFIENGMLGCIESFHVAEGGIYNWPVTSDFFFRRRTSGGGVLLDTGAHTLDLLLWWLGEVASFEYFDDAVAEDGVEADCVARLQMASGATGVVELSRTRNLRNTAVIIGELADLEVDLRKNWLAIYPKGGPVVCRDNLVPQKGIVDLAGHKPVNGGAKIALTNGGLVGKHALECIAEEGKYSGHAYGTRDTGVLVPAEPFTEYTVHVYLKGTRGDLSDVPIVLRAGNADFKLIKNATIRLTDSWKRHSITFTTGAGDDGISIAVWKKDHAEPIRWLADGFQMERGPGNGYYGPERPAAVLDSLGPDGPQSFTSLFHNQIRDFVAAVRGEKEPLVSGAEGRKAVALIERLYGDRELLTFEWQERRVFA